tara:strand:- start:217 stop:498 length:282 start_codon:yes stop_codon:yes gene_type:complete
MIYKELTKSQFRDEFEENDGFSYDGLGVLYDFIMEATSDNIELDVIELRSTYSEYDSIKDYNSDYNENYKDYRDITSTTVLGIDSDRFIIVNY